MTRRDPGLESALLAWREGARRLAEPGPLRPALRSVAEAVEVELRRRVGVTFTLADLLREYRRASTWYLELAARVAPTSPEAWDEAVVLDGAFGRYMRRATDAGLS